MKYPRSWVEAIYKVDKDARANYWGSQILDALSAVGALKEPPKAREIGVCWECCRPKHIYNLPNERCCGCGSKLQKFVEVLEER